MIIVCTERWKWTRAWTRAWARTGAWTRIWTRAWIGIQIGMDRDTDRVTVTDSKSNSVVRRDMHDVRYMFMYTHGHGHKHKHEHKQELERAQSTWTSGVPELMFLTSLLKGAAEIQKQRSLDFLFFYASCCTEGGSATLEIAVRKLSEAMRRFTGSVRRLFAFPHHLHYANPGRNVCSIPTSIAPCPCSVSLYSYFSWKNFQKLYCCKKGVEKYDKLHTSRPLV